MAMLDEAHVSDDVCNCFGCLAGITQAVADGWRCDWCGYSGRPVALRCECYDTACQGHVACLHGALVCPICDDGEVDAWGILRRLQEALGA